MATQKITKRRKLRHSAATPTGKRTPHGVRKAKYDLDRPIPKRKPKGKAEVVRQVGAPVKLRKPSTVESEASLSVTAPPPASLKARTALAQVEQIMQRSVWPDPVVIAAMREYEVATIPAKNRATGGFEWGVQVRRKDDAMLVAPALYADRLPVESVFATSDLAAAAYSAGTVAPMFERNPPRYAELIKQMSVSEAVKYIKNMAESEGSEEAGDGQS